MKTENAFYLPLLAGVHLVALPLYSRMPVAIISVIAIFSLWVWLIDQNKTKRPNRMILLIAVAVVISVLLVSYGTIFGQQPGTSMLVLLSFLKIFEMKDNRDISVTVFLGYFILASSFFHTQSIYIALYVFAVVIYLTSLLVMLSDKNNSLNIKQRLQVSARMLGLALPLMLVLFVLFPRIPGPLWGLPKDALSATTGISDEMSPGSINRLISSGNVAFRVKFQSDNIPAKKNLYWRGLVLSEYDGKTWRKNDAPNWTVPDVNEGSGDIIYYTITLEPHNQKWLYSLEQFVEYEQDLEVFRELQLYTNKRVNQVMNYSLGSRFNAENRALFEKEYEKNIDLPVDLNPNTVALADRLWRESGNNREVYINRVLEYFRNNNFVYSLSPDILGENAMDDFLFKTRKGFCEHYSSSFVYLMRAAEIPARVVVGYQGGEMNPVDDYMIVRQSDAHAWAEVWQGGKWRRIDPTAAVSPARVEAGVQNAGLEAEYLPAVFNIDSSLLNELRFAYDSFNHSWNQWVIGFNEKKQKELFSRLGFENISFSTLFLWLVVLMTVTGLIIAAFIFLRKTKEKTDRAKYYFDILCAKLAKKGLPRKLHESEQEYFDRIKKHIPESASLMSIIIKNYQRIRYGENHNEKLLKQFMRQIKQFRTGKVNLIS